MVFYHGTNVDKLTGEVLEKGSWVTPDPYRAAAYSSQLRGLNIVYIVWCDEQEVEFVYLPGGVIPDWKIKKDKKPVGRLIYNVTSKKLVGL